MDDSMAHPAGEACPMDLPAWKTVAGHIAAVLTAALFVSSGLWKITDPFGWATLVEQLKVPYAFSMPLTLALAVLETFTGVLVLVPRFRRWGAWLAGGLLVVFMIYIGANYTALVGKDCSCFPSIKRTVGPTFFVSDMVMLLLAALAGWWARPSLSRRSAAVVLGAVAVFAAVSYGVAATHQTGAKAPETITVDGKPFSLEHGRFFVYFYDPQCMHCDLAARRMAKMTWKDTTIIAVPTSQPQWAGSFLGDTGLKALTSLDLRPLKQVFPFGDPPYGVVIEDGREKGPVSRYDPPEPEQTLRKLGVIE